MPVTRTFWLASYPMSGTTWLRVFIANLSARDIPTDINDTRFAKVHCAYTLADDGTSIRQDASGAIVIVRDPRDIAPSLAVYNRSSIDDSVTFMDNPDAFGATANRQSQRMLTRWSHHVASWLEQKDIPVHLVRYEDLVADPFTSVRRVLRFTGVAVGDDTIRRSIAVSDFRAPRAQEIEKGSQESQPFARRFFRRVGGWRDELTAPQTARIESDHGAMMQRLGYTLSPRSTAASQK
jgi:aryl sulfotransferase